MKKLQIFLFIILCSITMMSNDNFFNDQGIIITERNNEYYFAFTTTTVDLLKYEIYYDFKLNKVMNSLGFFLDIEPIHLALLFDFEIYPNLNIDLDLDNYVPRFEIGVKKEWLSGFMNLVLDKEKIIKEYYLGIEIIF